MNDNSLKTDKENMAEMPVADAQMVQKEYCWFYSSSCQQSAGLSAGEPEMDLRSTAPAKGLVEQLHIIGPVELQQVTQPQGPGLKCEHVPSSRKSHGPD